MIVCCAGSRLNDVRDIVMVLYNKITGLALYDNIIYTAIAVGRSDHDTRWRNLISVMSSLFQEESVLWAESSCFKREARLQSTQL